MINRIFWMRIIFLAIFTSYFGHLRYLLTGKGCRVECNLSPSLLTCITPVCLKLALGWISHGRATLSCNTWFHKSGMSQQVDSATGVRVDCDDTVRSERSPQTIQKHLQGFLRLCQRQGTCLNTKCVPNVRISRKCWLSVKSDSLRQEWKGWHHVLGAVWTLSTFGTVMPDCESACSYVTVLTQRRLRPVHST